MPETSQQSALICQKQIPFDVSPRALPGVRPLEAGDWLSVDEAFAGQMGRRDALLNRARETVLRCADTAIPAARELLENVLEWQTRRKHCGYDVNQMDVTRPDGHVVPINWNDPLDTLGRLIQEDLCILEKRGEEPVMTGAVLCFPASWLLDEKFERPMTAIHGGVPSYDTDIARRVQRLFDGVQVDRPLWRFNRLWYADAALHQPRSVHVPRPEPTDGATRFFRCEKQCLIRLPRTRAVVFSIHTYVLREADAPAAAFLY